MDQSIHDIFSACEKAVLHLEERDEKEENIADKEYVDCIWKAAIGFGFFDPDVQPDEDWVQRSLLDYLNMYRRNILIELINNGSEQDFVVRCWSNLDRCFENLGVVARYVLIFLNYSIFCIWLGNQLFRYKSCFLFQFGKIIPVW